MIKLTAFFTAAAIALTLPLVAADEKSDKAESQEIKGEIVDLACYTDHGASGEKHVGCAMHCITSGLPVGIKSADGKVYTVIGDHKPMNSELAEFAGKVITLRGKVVSRDGVTLLENAEIVK